MGTDTSRLGIKLNGFVEMNKKKSDLRVTLGKLTLKNPVLTASGTFGYAGEFEKLIDLNRLGGIIVKGLSLEASRGNPPPRESLKHRAACSMPLALKTWVWKHLLKKNYRF